MKRNRCFGIATTLALAFLSSNISTAWAGQLDRELIKNTGPILEYLSKHKVVNVGVLPFVVKKGSREASFVAAPLALSMPTRLENTLIMALEEDSFGIVRDSAGTANKAKVGDYLGKKADFDKLFATKYDRAWDRVPVRVDCFLTGRVEYSPKNPAKSKVIIEAFDRTSWKDGKVVLKTVDEFDVPIDRTLLAEQGYNFALSRSALSPKVKPSDRTKLASRLVMRREVGSTVSEEGVNDTATPDDIAGFAFEVRYDGKKQEIKLIQSTKDGQKAPEYELPSAPPGTKITMHLKRTDADEGALGIVLKVNGLSTCDKEDADSYLCRRWIFGPEMVGKPDTYKGFYMGADASQLFLFEAMGKEEAKGLNNKLGARTGWIDIDVFASQGEKKPKLAKAELEESEAPLVMTRSVPRNAKKGTKFEDYQKALFTANRQHRVESLVRMKALGIVYHAVAPVPSSPISETTLPNPEHIGHLSIRYGSGK